MQIQVLTANSFTVIAVQGRIDTITAGDFEAKVLALLDQGMANLVIDCTNMDYISSSGLRVFLIVQKKVAVSRGTLRLCSLKPSIREVFDISGFSTIFSIFPDQESATVQ